jgi:hypothetical protein
MANPEEVFGRDPAFYAQDVFCAVKDMAEQFPRDELIAALTEALKGQEIEIVDLKDFRNAA